MAAVAGRPSALQRGSCKLQQPAAGLRHGGTHGPGMTRSTVVVVIASIAALVVLVLAHVVAFHTPAGVAAMAVTAMTAALDAADGARGTLQLSPAVQQAGESC